MLYKPAINLSPIYEHKSLECVDIGTLSIDSGTIDSGTIDSSTIEHRFIIIQEVW
jgi:hypothetical protein